MKTLNLIAAAMMTATLTISLPVTAMAHSGHNNTPLPLSWEFNDSVHDKILRAIHDDARMNKVGLSHLEQTILERYGIRVGYTFYTPVDGRQALVKRTQSGLQILKSSVPASSGFQWKAPIMERYTVVPSSLPAMQHPGHHHSHLNLAWLFDPEITGKIKRHLDGLAYPMLIGLSKTEQKMADRYGIETGNSFITTVGGEDYLVQRTSSGLQVMKKVMENAPVAAQPIPATGTEVKG